MSTVVSLPIGRATDVEDVRTFEGGGLVARAWASANLSLLVPELSRVCECRISIADTAPASPGFALPLDSPAPASSHPPQGGCTYSLHGSTTWCAAAVRSGVLRDASQRHKALQVVLFVALAGEGAE